MSRPTFAFRYEMKAEKGKGDVYVYSYIVSQKYGKEDPDVSAESFRKDLESIGSVNKLNIHINSGGGDVFQGVSMRSAIMNHEATEKNVYIEGLCASAATLLAAIPGAKVHITKGSEYMIHNPKNRVIGEAKDMEAEAKHLRQMEATFQEIYSARCGKDLDTVKDWMDKTTWFTAEQAVKEGFADEVLGATSTQAVACAQVDTDTYEMMAEMYGELPGDITAQTNDVSNGTGAVAAPAPTENKNNGTEETNMPENQNMTAEQLRETNSALYNEISAAAIQQERERMSQIDDLTIPGYEAMAEEAKKNGTSAVDFMAKVAAAQRSKRQNYLDARAQETAKAAQVPAADAADNPKPKASAEDEIEAFAKAVADDVKHMKASGDTMY